MKKVEIKKGSRIITIETKWLRIDEAATYLGVVRSTFDELRTRIPHGLVKGVVVYDCQILDRYASHELPEDVYEDETINDVMKKRPYTRHFGSEEGLTHPITGKVYRSGGSRGRRGSALRGELPAARISSEQTTATAAPDCNERKIGDG